MNVFNTTHAFLQLYFQKLKICVLGAVLLPLRVIFILLSLSLATAIARFTIVHVQQSFNFSRIGLIGISDEELAAAPFTGWRLYIRHVGSFSC